jgi:hypothetical protein
MAEAAINALLAQEQSVRGLCGVYKQVARVGLGVVNAF